jgi:DNA repair exonuclease SbcCD nuclease subunit
MSEPDQYVGLFLIGDPHLEGRPPGFRKDDYPTVILDKLAWCLDYARQHRLLPAILGDLFDKPRDNPNWLLSRLLEILQGEILGLYGNHDVHYDPQLTEHDSLSLLVQAGRIRLVSAESPWRGRIAGRTVIVGGSSYRQEIPEQFANDSTGERPFVVWLTHHDILIPGYDEGRLKPAELPGIDLIVNGHIHRRLESIQSGGTAWLTPGNISRRSRNDATRTHVPAALRIDVSPTGYAAEHVTIPHGAFDDVFHEAVVETIEETAGSAFVAGLAELLQRRTASGAGLLAFLDQNLDQFDPAVAAEIRTLTNEVTNAPES